MQLAQEGPVHRDAQLQTPGEVQAPFTHAGEQMGVEQEAPDHPDEHVLHAAPVQWALQVQVLGYVQVPCWQLEHTGVLHVAPLQPSRQLLHWRPTP